MLVHFLDALAEDRTLEAEFDKAPEAVMRDHGLSDRVVALGEAERWGR